MKYLFIISILTFSFNLVHLHPENQQELKWWIKNHHITFGIPQTPDGFERFLDCGDVIAFRKKVNDTLIVYSRGSSIAENVAELNKSIQKSNWNILRYPIYTQKNGTIVVQNMRKWTFLIKPDTLYLLDTYDEKKADKHMKIMEKFFQKEITEKEFKKLVNENEAKDYGFIPKFKAIYFKGIFDKKNTYKFSKKENFRKETVTLKNSWTENGTKYYEINLKTNTAGNYILSEDFNFINTENCNE
ncbi:hypothetical protein ACE01N_20200 [Saccharicrinis sp. FJH2]|uniref:hypothetical protein n=1 Tax=Saccharicrinis sp. FJH65 TaxID=3344659 RepID=UPI0035F39432